MFRNLDLSPSPREVVEYTYSVGSLTKSQYPTLKPSSED
jgi:hypothetical protein